MQARAVGVGRASRPRSCARCCSPAHPAWPSAARAFRRMCSMHCSRCSTRACIRWCRRKGPLAWPTWRRCRIFRCRCWGEGFAEYRGEILPGDEALARAGLAPVQFAAKDGLALISANAATVGHAALVLHDCAGGARCAECRGRAVVRGLSRQPEPARSARAGRAAGARPERHRRAPRRPARRQRAVAARCRAPRAGPAVVALRHAGPRRARSPRCASHAITSSSN